MTVVFLTLAVLVQEGGGVPGRADVEHFVTCLQPPWGGGDRPDRRGEMARGAGGTVLEGVVRRFLYPPPPLYKLRPCPSYSRRRDRNNFVRNLITYEM